MESLGLLIALVLVKAAFGRVFCHQLFQLNALKMQISISTKTTIPANKSIHDRNTAVVLLCSHKAAGGGRCRFFAEKITVVLQLWLEFGLWLAAVCSGSSGGGCRAAPAHWGSSRRNVRGWQKLGKC